MNVKVAQYVTLFLSICATVGIPELAKGWLNSHVSIYSGIVVAAIVLHAIFPSIFAAPSQESQAKAGLPPSAMFLLALLFLGATAFGQSIIPPASTANGIQNLYAGGVSYNVGATPAVAGTGIYARNLDTGASLPTYAFTVIDALPNTVKPFSVSTNVGVGIAQQVGSFGKVKVWIPTAAGISWSGGNTGWNWNGGGAATIPIKNGWGIMPSLRFLKSSVGGGGNGYQIIPGVLVYWGK